MEMDISNVLSAITKQPFSIISKLIFDFTVARSRFDVDFANKHFTVRMNAKAIFVVTMIDSSSNVRSAMPSLSEVIYYDITQRSIITEKVLRENSALQELAKENEKHKIFKGFSNMLFSVFLECKDIKCKILCF